MRLEVCFFVFLIIVTGMLFVDLYFPYKNKKP